MTPEELLEHETAWYGRLAKLTLLGSWQAKLGSKRFTVIVYRAKPDKAIKGHIPKDQYRCAISYGKRILTSIIIDQKGK